MKIIRTSLALAAFFCFLLPLRAQYTLNEMGVNAGGGYGFYLNPVAELRGPAARVSGFYSHYFCGKAYGIQAQVGIQGIFPNSTNAHALFPVTPEESQITLRRIQGEVGFFFKLRPHDYHRRKEWAFLIGPVLPNGITTTFAFDSPSANFNGNWDILEVTQSISPVLHASFQLRRPLGDDLSYFIQPGVEIGPTPAFETEATSFRSFNAFITIGFSFWEKRG